MKSVLQHLHRSQDVNRIHLGMNSKEDLDGRVGGYRADRASCFHDCDLKEVIGDSSKWTF
jgi:hypothetical protein